MDGNLLVVTGICNSDTGDSYFAADRHITPNSKTRNNITHTWPDISPQIAQQYYSYFLTAWPDIKITILLVSPLFCKCQIYLHISIETYHHCLSEDDEYHSSLFLFCFLRNIRWMGYTGLTTIQASLYVKFIS